MNRQEAERLVEKYLDKTATEQERLLVENWYADFSDKKTLTDEDDFEHLAAELWKGTRERAGIIPSKRILIMWRQIAAAILLFVMLASYYKLFYHHLGQSKSMAVTHDIAPGTNKAILTLANGNHIILSGGGKGRLTLQDDIVINKKQDGSIAYNKVSESSGPTLYNTTATPIGAEFELTLEDGTIVKLDAASSIRYPVSFKGNERRVEITGQVYFEVAHDKQRPFIVGSKNQTIEVLGTHFNVNAYGDNAAITTTLLQGSVKINYGSKSALLKPGEQAIAKNGNSISVEKADAEEAIAWKNGYFRFKEENIQDVMQKISRWYNISVVYNGAISDEQYSGVISRYKNISQVLKMLAYSGSVHFKVDGRRVSVSK